MLLNKLGAVLQYWILAVVEEKLYCQNTQILGGKLDTEKVLQGQILPCARWDRWDGDQSHDPEMVLAGNHQNILEAESVKVYWDCKEAILAVVLSEDTGPSDVAPSHWRSLSMYPGYFWGPFPELLAYRQAENCCGKLIPVNQSYTPVQVYTSLVNGPKLAESSLSGNTTSETELANRTETGYSVLCGHSGKTVRLLRNSALVVLRLYEGVGS
jgi:hypothetical protein